MWLILLEAGLALGLFVFIVWWTMFHGRPKERARTEALPRPPAPDAEDGAAGRPPLPPGPGASPAPGPPDRPT